MYCYGLDAHCDWIKVHRKDMLTGERKIFSVNIQSENFEKFQHRFTHEDFVTFECSTNSFFLYDQLNPFVKQTYVLNPRELGKAKMKTDKRDAKKLADKLSYALSLPDPLEELPVVYVPDPKVRELRRLFTTYNVLKSQIVGYKNQIHSLIKQHGKLVGKDTIENIGVKESILNMNIPDTVKVQVEVFYRLIDLLNQEVHGIKDCILKTGDVFSHEIYLLTSIKGISVFGAIAIMTDVATVERFKDAKHFCSYLRTAPGVDASNKTVKITSVSKVSRKLAQQTLIQCICHFKAGSKKIEEFYNRKIQGKPAGKVRMAVARKMMVAIFHMLKKNELYYYTDKKKHEQKVKEYENFLKKCA